MAHELDITDGIASFASARLDAWHQLGQVLPGAMTADEALEAAHLSGWNVRKLPLVAEVEGNLVAVPDRFTVVRDNPIHRGVEALGVVGDRYTVVQNEEHAQFLDNLVDESGAHFETAGALRGGRQTFITMKVPAHINIGGVDPFDTYLAAINSHDGTGAFTILATPVRIVCANTLAMAVGGRSPKVSIRHTRNATQRIGEARRALDLSFAYLDTFQKQAEQLLDIEMTNAQFDDLIRKTYGAPEGSAKSAVTRSESRLDELTHLFEAADTQAAVRNTAWAGLNALTEYWEHFSPTRGSDNEADTRALRTIEWTENRDKALKAVLAATGN